MELVFATGNAGKLREAREILSEDVKIISAAEAGYFDDPAETALTFRGNALIKAQALYDATGKDCFADDSGLEVDYLLGAPGIYSARYASDHDFSKNIDLVLQQLEGQQNRAAKFTCCVCLILGGEPHFFEGSCPGSIATCRSGEGGFGYDPIFIPDAYPDKTISELTEELKNQISHRGEALRKMAFYLKSL